MNTFTQHIQVTIILHDEDGDGEFDVADRNTGENMPLMPLPHEKVGCIDFYTWEENTMVFYHLSRAWHSVMARRSLELPICIELGSAAETRALFFEVVVDISECEAWDIVQKTSDSSVLHH